LRLHYTGILYKQMVQASVSYSCGETLPTVHGILNGSVYLPSGLKNRNVSWITWSAENDFIATLINGKLNTMINIRYNKRLHLHTNNGSLQINRLKMGDTLTYNVHIVYQDNSQNNNQVKLVVHEKINKPNLETSANFSTINTCNVSVICSTTQGFSASSDCDNRSGVFRCSESNVTNSSVGISITITTKGNTIVCNSSNLVSWNTDRIEQVC
uniref:Immunoglobulin V-set domain-containing protein n=1 Tax=Lepisosteus oculatus TaxID=7918 RepID=W5LZB4_LEPOC